MNLSVVITMAGQGARFREAGYLEPKFMIEVKGRTLFEWSLLSLEDLIRRGAHLRFVALREHEARGFITEQLARLGADRWSLLELDSVTDGQATTVMKASGQIDPRHALAVFNIDTHVKPGSIHWAPEFQGCAIPCFSAPGDHWSFVRLDGGRVVEIAEKKRISDNASIGFYGFESIGQFAEAYEAHYGAAQGAAAEKYIAPMYNSVLLKEIPVSAPLIPSGHLIALGTPAEVERFRARPELYPLEEPGPR